jgi:hypothetical protein
MSATSTEVSPLLMACVADVLTGMTGIGAGAGTGAGSADGSAVGTIVGARKPVEYGAAYEVVMMAFFMSLSCCVTATPIAAATPPRAAAPPTAVPTTSGIFTLPLLCG